jgi:minor extracellular serine protease Vpr
MKNTSLALSLALLASACGLNTSPQELKKLELVNSAVISIRGNAEVEVFMVRLKTPALVESSTTVNGQLVLNEVEKQKMIQEQVEFLKTAQSISSEIQMIYSTKIIMNSVTIVAPPHVMGQINGLPMVQNARAISLFSAPSALDKLQVDAAMAKKMKDLANRNSVAFIGAEEARAAYGIDGQGIRVGVIDTGIDYTHTMFGGSGSVDEFKAIDASKPTPLFPTAKIPGGVDLVGDEYSPGSPYRLSKLPRPDSNPLDYNGHGTHVAGTVAGLGDGVTSYDGVAPAATLYGIKVFGKNSTSDAVVIAALEYSLDPNGDLDPSDKLDVVNLSLGSDYGKPSLNYTEAIKNTVKAGVSVVAAAGNAGDKPFIVGAPSTTPEAISVAAGIDNMIHNVEVDGSEFSIDGAATTTILSPVAQFSRQLTGSETVKEELVYAGQATEEFSPDLAQKVAGKIAIVDRGVNAFADKAGFALKAGAIGVVIANNNPNDPIVAGGGSGVLSIPVVMIRQADGVLIKEALKEGKKVDFVFSAKIKFQRNELVDTITDFSSRGPRSEDGIIKPELVAPGQQIVSADTGTGSGVARLNGTSMASPHMAGVMALMKQKYPTLTVTEQKHLLMSRTKIISDKNGVRYPVSAQGAGRVDVMHALDAKLLPSRGEFSLGRVSLGGNAAIRESITLTNFSNEDLSLSVTGDFSGGLSVETQTITIPAGKSVKSDLVFGLNTIGKARSIYEGYVKLSNGGEVVATFPVLAVAHQHSDVRISVKENGPQDISLDIANPSAVKGEILPFYLLGNDPEKPSAGPLAAIRSRACDLESAGFRFLEKQSGLTQKSFLQLGVKLYDLVTDWESCNLSVQIDTDNDGEADLEWVGITESSLPGLDRLAPAGFYSVLLDAKKAKTIRSQFERVQRDSQGQSTVEQDYADAILHVGEYKPFHQSSVTMMEIPMDVLKVQGDLKLKLSVLNGNENSIEPDDFLGSDWMSVIVPQSIDNWPQLIEVNAQESLMLDLFKAQAIPMIFYSPMNQLIEQKL